MGIHISRLELSSQPFLGRAQRPLRRHCGWLLPLGYVYVCLRLLSQLSYHVSTTLCSASGTPLGKYAPEHNKATSSPRSQPCTRAWLNQADQRARALRRYQVKRLLRGPPCYNIKYIIVRVARNENQLPNISQSRSEAPWGLLGCPLPSAFSMSVRSFALRSGLGSFRTTRRRFIITPNCDNMAF